jgi:hypothetical protein
MKLSLIISVIALATVGCAASQPPPIQQPTVVTVRQLPQPPAKGEMVEDSMVIVEEEIPATREETNPADYQRLSSLIHRETVAIKCICANGDPLCFCRLPNGPKILPKE